VATTLIDGLTVLTRSARTTPKPSGSSAPNAGNQTA
jgi:hypothetical protein